MAFFDGNMVVSAGMAHIRDQISRHLNKCRIADQTTLYVLHFHVTSDVIKSENKHGR